MIKITDKYYADNDKYNWILIEKTILTEEQAKKRKDAKPGDEELKIVSYHMNLEQLLTSLYEKHKKKIGKNTDLKSYIDELHFLQEDFINKIKNIEKIVIDKK